MWSTSACFHSLVSIYQQLGCFEDVSSLTGFLLMFCKEMLLLGTSVSNCQSSTKNSGNPPSAWYHQTLPKTGFLHIGISRHHKTENPLVFLQEGQVHDVMEYFLILCSGNLLVCNSSILHDSSMSPSSCQEPTVLPKPFVAFSVSSRCLLLPAASPVPTEMFVQPHSKSDPQVDPG